MQFQYQISDSRLSIIDNNSKGKKMIIFCIDTTKSQELKPCTSDLVILSLIIAYGFAF